MRQDVRVVNIRRVGNHKTTKLCSHVQAATGRRSYRPPAFVTRQKWDSSSRPCALPTPTTRLNDGTIPTTKRARWRPFNFKCVDPSLRHCEGCLWHSTSSNRPGFRQRSLDYDSGVFPMLCEDEPLTRAFLGHDGQRPRLCRAWADLRWCMPNSLPEVERETIG
jgi:hypothetical protein